MPDSPVSAGVRQAVGAVDWAAYAMAPSAEWYRPDSVPVAFELLLAASNQQEGRAAYNAMLFAVGNNHAGLLYPAALPAAQLLVRVARECEGWVRWAALEILIEFMAFDVDREQFVAPSGALVHTKKAIIAPIRSLLGDLELIAQDEHSAVPTAQSARELLDCLLNEQQDGSAG
jgi:hypothetical protein